MTIFDQRYQKVGTQINLNMQGVSSAAELVSELKKVQAELTRLTEEGALAENGADAEASVKKAVIEAQKPEPDRKKLADHLAKAKAAIEGVAAAAGLITALAKAAELIEKLF